MSFDPPALDSIATVKAKTKTELRALQNEAATLESRLVVVRDQIAVRVAVLNAIAPTLPAPAIRSITPTPRLSIQRTGVVR